MKQLICLLLLLPIYSFANMASPILPGSTNTNAFTSSHIDILKERIDVYLSKDSSTAVFDVQYTIRTQVAGRQIPLLFVTEQYSNGFSVWIDGQPVIMRSLPEPFYDTTQDLCSFRPYFKAAGDHTIAIDWRPGVTDRYDRDELHYFEASPDTGVHTIRVRYTADPQLHRMEWTSKYTFGYMLKPATYWQSFGHLDIVLHKTGFPFAITTDLPGAQISDTAITWQTNQAIPDHFSISYTPVFSGLAGWLIRIDPFRLAIITGICLALLHVWLMYRHRRRSAVRFSAFMIAGALLVPFFFCFSYMWFHDLIDLLISPWDSRYHGYTFLVFVFYPLITPVYLLLAWLADRYFKKRSQKHSIQ